MYIEGVATYRAPAEFVRTHLRDYNVYLDREHKYAHDQARHKVNRTLWTVSK